MQALRRITCCLALATGSAAADPLQAIFSDPTTRYTHGVLGDAVEWGSLTITADGKSLRVVLPQDRVFEDIAPRLWDITGDGQPEIVVVETQVQQGAQLAIYDRTGTKIAATPHIGQAQRWLAPVGAADMDGDGAIEIAYVDRPHLAKLLKVWRFDAGQLSQVAELPNLTNHRIGQDFITGGVRNCGGDPTLIVVSGDWRTIMQVTYAGDGYEAVSLGPFEGQASVRNALGC